MDPIDRSQPETVERLAPTGTRLPVWYRLPEQPPLTEHGNQYPDHHYSDEQYPDPLPADTDAIETVETNRTAVTAPPVIPLAPAPCPLVPAPDRRRGTWLQTVVAAVLGAVLALTGSALLDGEEIPAVVTAATLPTAAPVAGSTDTAGIAAEVVPSIVTIMVGTDSTDGLQPLGSGSGVIITADGLIVTNDHVVAGAPDYQVVLADGRTSYPATLVGTDPVTDLAVLQVDATGLQPIALGATDTLEVGDGAIAVGSPLGLGGGPSVTVGVVSAFGRQVTVAADTTLFGMLQTDAPITEGSSGGALVDTAGRLIGITTAVGVSNVGVEGIGFATPVELMNRVVDELVADGSVDHAFLGIVGATTFDTAADGARVAAGVQIASVEPGTPADQAGLARGDVITSVDGEPIETMDELVIVLRYQGAGDSLSFAVAPAVGESTRNIDVVLGAL